MLASPFRTFFSGLCVGAADIVPGISGGTVAFIIGIYEELLESIASINSKALGLLSKGKLASFFTVVRWKFLCLFILGVACSIVTLAKTFEFFLNHEVYRSFLYSAFMGLVMGSCVFCAKQLSRFSFGIGFALVCGAIVAYCLSGTDFVPAGASTYSDGFVIDLWVVVCGAMAVSAMLLPGISGSYILNVLGMYGPILGALVSFIDGLKAGMFHMAAFRIVASMAIGIALGALLFARVVRYLLYNYRDATIGALVGFMVGALKSVWPFWTYSSDASNKLKVLEPILPEVNSVFFLLSLGFFALGIGAVFLVEYIATKKAVSVK